MSTRTKIMLGAILASGLQPLAAQAHWCNDMWSSAYNIVVRPASDTVTVPSSGSANLNLFVQNNMGYPLDSFALTAQIGSAQITATRQTQKVASMLLPGEKAKYTLAVTKSGGGAVAIGDISFLVSFGASGESGMYGTSPGKAVMIRKNDGSLVPAPPPPGIGTGSDQARQLQYSALADFSDINAGLDKLMTYYCAGRGSWNSGSDAVIAAACTGTATDCTKATRALSSGMGTKYDYPHLWGALELVVRKGSLGTRLAPLRLRLQCGAGDANVGFAYFAMMMLGYLGDDPGARTFLEGKVGTTDIGTVAKAALMLFGADDATKYEADVRAGLSKGAFVAAACATALGIAKLDDATVTSALVPLAKWVEPDTSDNGQGLYAAHLLALAAWDRRCWAAQAADSGPVTFYEGGTPARTCSATPGTGGSTGFGGSTGSGGSAGSGGSSGSGGSTGSGGGTRAGGTVASGGSVGSGGSTATGGRTGTASGGSTGTPAGGSTVIGTGGSTGTPSGGNTGTRSGGSTGTPSGGSTGTPSGGSTGTPSGGSTGTPSGGSTGTPSGGSTGTRSGGSTGTSSGGSTGAGSGGQTGNGGAQSSGTAKTGGSAGGCGYIPSDRAPLGLLLVGVGLVLAARRRRR